MSVSPTGAQRKERRKKEKEKDNKEKKEKKPSTVSPPAPMKSVQSEPISLILLTQPVPSLTKICGTHGGHFHCDEVLAIWMLMQTSEWHDMAVIRTRKQEYLSQCHIFVDIGGEYDPSRNRFDHHQRDFNETLSPNHRTKLSSAGLVYKHYGKEVISRLTGEKNPVTIDLIFEQLYEELIEAIDANDNGIDQYPTEIIPNYLNSSTTLSARIARLNPKWCDPVQRTEKGFVQAIAECKREFEDQLDHITRSVIPAEAYLEKSIQNRFSVHPSGQIIELAQLIPWQGLLWRLEEKLGIEPQILFVIFPGSANMWRVCAVPLKKGFALRLPLLEEWRGLAGKELQEKSRIKGSEFVHANGWVGGNTMRKNAIKMAVVTIENHKRLLGESSGSYKYHKPANGFAMNQASNFTNTVYGNQQQATYASQLGGQATYSSQLLQQQKNSAGNQNSIKFGGQQSNLSSQLATGGLPSPTQQGSSSNSPEPDSPQSARSVSPSSLSATSPGLLSPPQQTFHSPYQNHGFYEVHSQNSSNFSNGNNQNHNGYSHPHNTREKRGFAQNSHSYMPFQSPYFQPMFQTKNVFMTPVIVPASPSASPKTFTPAEKKIIPITSPPPKVETNKNKDQNNN